MTESEKEFQATTLCKSCGLCCSGHLFTWVKLRSPEVRSATALGLHVLGTDPEQRGFNQPCPLWNGECTIHNAPEYPRSCRTYQCRLLKNLLDETTTLPAALSIVQAAKDRIRSLDLLLPVSSNCNFRERLVAHLESGQCTPEVERQAFDLLRVFQNEFGVKDIVDLPDER
jgi:hypothetical protein